jgi:hypothetical protein
MFQKKIFNSTSLLAIISIVVMRIVPHIPNATPVGFSLLHVTRKYGMFPAFGVLFISLVVSDLMLGFYSWKLMLSVYGSFLGYVFVAWWLSRVEDTVIIRALALLAGSFIFFLGSNISVWAFSSWYPHDMIGLLMCLVAGLPFLGTMMLGDGVCLLLYAISRRFLPILLQKKIPYHYVPHHI